MTIPKDCDITTLAIQDTENGDETTQTYYMGTQFVGTGVKPIETPEEEPIQEIPIEEPVTPEPEMETPQDDPENPLKNLTTTQLVIYGLIALNVLGIVIVIVALCKRKKRKNK